MRPSIAIPRWATGPFFVLGDLAEPAPVPVQLHAGAVARLSVLEANWPGGTGWPAAVDPRWRSARCERVPGGYRVIPLGREFRFAGEFEVAT